MMAMTLCTSSCLMTYVHVDHCLMNKALEYLIIRFF